jgi:hypothetical protein
MKMETELFFVADADGQGKYIASKDMTELMKTITEIGMKGNKIQRIGTLIWDDESVRDTRTNVMMEEMQSMRTEIIGLKEKFKDQWDDLCEVYTLRAENEKLKKENNQRGETAAALAIDATDHMLSIMHNNWVSKTKGFFNVETRESITIDNELRTAERRVMDAMREYYSVRWWK